MNTNIGNTFNDTTAVSYTHLASGFVVESPNCILSVPEYGCLDLLLVRWYAKYLMIIVLIHVWNGTPRYYLLFLYYCTFHLLFPCNVLGKPKHLQYYSIQMICDHVVLHTLWNFRKPKREQKLWNCVSFFFVIKIFQMVLFFFVCFFFIRFDGFVGFLLIVYN